MVPPSTSPAEQTSSPNPPLLHRQNAQLCPSPTTVWGPFGPTPSTAYVPCNEPVKPCSGIPKAGVIGIPLAITVLFILLLIWTFIARYNSGHYHGFQDGRMTRVRDERGEQRRSRERAGRRRARDARRTTVQETPIPSHGVEEPAAEGGEQARNNTAPEQAAEQSDRPQTNEAQTSTAGNAAQTEDDGPTALRVEDVEVLSDSEVITSRSPSPASDATAVGSYRGEGAG